jgi:hypothetical protein
MFISPETGRLSCLVDWQHAFIQPQLLAAGYPPTFENPDHELPENVTPPKLPENIASLPPAEQVTERERYRRRLLFYTYHESTGALNPLHILQLYDPMLLVRKGWWTRLVASGMEIS